MSDISNIIVSGLNTVLTADAGTWNATATETVIVAKNGVEKGQLRTDVPYSIEFVEGEISKLQQGMMFVEKVGQNYTFKNP